MVRGKAVGKLYLGLILLLTVALIAGACGDDDEDEVAAVVAPAATEVAEEVAAVAEPDEAAAEEEVAVTVVERGTVRWPYNDLILPGAALFDPASPGRFASAIRWLYDRAVLMDFDGVPTPGLATSWEVNPTGTQWTFTIRQGVTFSDGSPLTARDAAFSLLHQVDPDVGSPMASVLEIIDTDRLETPDDFTLVINLNNAHVDFPLLLKHYSMGLIPDGRADEIAHNPVGTGPLTLNTFEPEGLSVFDSRDDYWGGLPGAATFTIVQIADADTRLNALLADQIDLTTGLTIAQAQLVERDSDFYIQESSTGSTVHIPMIVTEEPFTDKRVRTAMKLLVDREEMLAVALQGHGTINCNNPVWPIDQYYFEQTCPQDIEGARALLAEAGYADGLSVEMAVADLNPSWIPVATIYKEQAVEAGVEVNIVSVPSDTYWSEVWMVHPLSPTNWAMRPADQFMNEAFRCGANWGENFWCNEEFGSLLDQARAETDFDRRRDLYIAAQQVQIDDGGMIGIFFQNDIRALNNRLQGYDVRTLPNEVRFHELYIQE